MRRIFSIAAATFVAALVAAPATLAQNTVEPWSSFGQYEPNTALDDPQYMWHTGPGETNDRVYFNAFTMYYQAHSGNVGALRTQNEVYFLESQEALFGVWSDCNGDGYIGHAETGLIEYRSALLLDDSVCETTTGPGNSWVAGAHNYNGWVTELIPIAQTKSVRDQRVYEDRSAKIWGDYGLPDQPLGGEGGAGSACALRPVPRGTFETTGGLFNYLDCNAAFMDFWNIPWSTEAVGDPLGLRFEDNDDARGSQLDMPLFGSDSSEHSAVTVWDCSRPYVFRSGDALNMTPAGALTRESSAHNYVIWSPSPGVGSSDPTVPGTYNHTVEGLEGGDADPAGNDGCDTSDDRGADFYGALGEGDVATDVSDGKNDAEWNFRYTNVNRGEAPYNVIGQASGNAGAPYALGIYTLGYGGWDCNCATIKLFQSPGVRAGLDRDDPTSSNPSVTSAEPYYLTYYASTALAFAKPGGTGTYGKAQCGEHEDVRNGWNCDAKTWYRNADGSYPNNVHLLGKVRDTYTHRDVDCYDGSNSLGVPTQFPALGDAPCARLA